jgi:hypothetical protein
MNMFARYFFGPAVLGQVLEDKRREAYLFATVLIV